MFVWLLPGATVPVGCAAYARLLASRWATDTSLLGRKSQWKCFLTTGVTWTISTVHWCAINWLLLQESFTIRKHQLETLKRIILLLIHKSLVTLCFDIKKLFILGIFCWFWWRRSVLGVTPCSWSRRPTQSHVSVSTCWHGYAKLLSTARNWRSSVKAPVSTPRPNWRHRYARDSPHTDLCRRVE